VDEVKHFDDKESLTFNDRVERRKDFLSCSLGLTHFDTKEQNNIEFTKEIAIPNAFMRWLIT